VLVAELLAILLSVARFNGDDFWPLLGNYSLFIQWVALVSAGLLCALRPRLRRFSDASAGLISYFLILAVTLIAALSAQMFERVVNPFITTIDWKMIAYSMTVSAILSAFWLRLFYLQAQYRLRLQAETEARLDALQARIKPHFLFNSMNILSSLITIKPELAEQVVDDLSALFRASLTEHDKVISLEKEVDICKHYVHIESLRLGERLQVDWQIDADLKRYKIPPLTLQPLIENSVYHGIQPLVEGGTITIKITADSRVIRLEITNPYKPGHQKSFEGHQVATENIRDRLKLLFGDEVVFERKELTNQYQVTLTLPVRVKDESIDR
jgi:two-component system sensor histidine kinase AlgZ